MGWLKDRFGWHTQREALNFWILQVVLTSILVGISLAVSIAGLAKNNYGYLMGGIMLTAIGMWCVRGSVRNLHFTVTLSVNKIKREA